MPNVGTTRVLAIGLGWAVLLPAQAPKPAPDNDEDFHVYSDAPRLLLTKQRLRLGQRERERMSPRWQMFDAFVARGRPRRQPGVGHARFYEVAGTLGAGRKAVEWALSNAADPVNDLRQLALVYDWCGQAMNAAQNDRLGAKIERGIAAAAQGQTRENEVPRQSARVLAAIAIADRFKDHGDSILRPIVDTWFRGVLVKRIEAGQAPIPREHTYAFMELMHALRDNVTA